MNKKYIIKNNDEINSIINKSIYKKNKYFVIYFENNKLKFNRYCVTVGKKITNAVNRNYIKRKIKDILMKNKLNYSKDYVIIVRKPVFELDYKTLTNELIELIKEA